MFLPVAIRSVPGHTGNSCSNSQTALTRHIDKNPGGCLNFLVKQTLSVAPHGSSVMQPQKHLHEDGSVTWTRNKERPAILRRHMVNDAVAAASGGVVFQPLSNSPIFKLLEQQQKPNFQSQNR